MKALAGLLLAALLALATLPAQAGIATAPGRDLRVELVTYGPGRVYWERFGHVALILRDTRDGEAVSFNYGVFEFSHDFFLKFIRGHMTYTMAAQYAGPEIASYIADGRAVRLQTLALTAAQAADLRDFLLWNYLPQHRHYRYDYFTDNCATRVRDAINLALHGALFAASRAPAAGRSFRTQTERMLAHEPALLVLVDLALGPYADQPLTQWQDAFLPQTLADLVEHTRLPDGKALASSDRVLYAGTVRLPPSQPPSLLWPLLAVALVWAAIILWGARATAGSAARVIGGAAAALYALLGGLVGLCMLALWTLTTHRAAWANENLLLFDPLLVLLLWPLLRRALRNRTGGRYARTLISVLLVLNVLALPAHLVGWLVQHNLHWILFALPLNAALWWQLRRTPAARATRATR